MQLLIITGLSGAGKSLALRRLEDLGYHCADNLPAAMAGEFVARCAAARPAIAHVAIGMDSREQAFGGGYEQALQALREQGVKPKILFLDCRDDVLRRRYGETRRRHPLASGGDLEAAIARERELLQPLRDRAHHILDTSDLRPLDLYRSLEELLGLDPLSHMVLLFMSFGFKRGVPVDADMVFDMRFLPNPFYDPALRPLSGLDVPIRDYIGQAPEYGPFLDDVERMLRRTLAGFAAQGRQRLMVAFGCTGGRHRSVAAAEELSRRFSRESGCSVRCFHRDIGQEAASIRDRFTPAQ